jgi:hypothetical protein
LALELGYDRAVTQTGLPTAYKLGMEYFIAVVTFTSDIFKLCVGCSLLRVSVPVAIMRVTTWSQNGSAPEGCY